MTAAASRLPKRRLCVSGSILRNRGRLAEYGFQQDYRKPSDQTCRHCQYAIRMWGLRESLTETVGNVFDHGCKLDAVDAVNASRKLKFTRGFCCYGCVWFRKRLGLKLTLFAGDGCAEYLRCHGDSRCSLAF